MENLPNELKFDGNGLVTAVIQDCESNDVLMVAYMNEEALKKSLETGKVHFWSRSRNRLWLKGETSGHYQYLKSVKIDCDGDALLIKVRQVNGACHTGHHTCFYRDLENSGMCTAYVPAAGDDVNYAGRSKVLHELYDIIKDRSLNPKEGSYTNYLFGKGLDKILKKVGEETAEVIIAAKNKSVDEIRYEIADLVYHLFVLMVASKVTLEDIFGELESRR